MTEKLYTIDRYTAYGIVKSNSTAVIWMADRWLEKREHALII